MSVEEIEGVLVRVGLAARDRHGKVAEGEAMVGGDAEAVVVHDADELLCERVALVGALLKESKGLGQRARAAVAIVEARGEAVHASHVAELGRALEALLGLVGIALAAFAVQPHEAEVVDGDGVVLLGGALEPLLGLGLVLDAALAVVVVVADEVLRTSQAEFGRSLVELAHTLVRVFGFVGQAIERVGEIAHGQRVAVIGRLGEPMDGFLRLLGEYSTGDAHASCDESYVRDDDGGGGAR